MKRNLMFVVLALTALSGGFVMLEETNALARTEGADGILEERVSANLMRVRVNGTWEEFPMTPLAQQACDIKDDLYLRYCD